MSDQELLRFAAKAAGGNFVIGYWNPLTDDGDALRLAVKLKITPHIDGNLTDAESAAGFSTEPHFDDPNAATRRAIVRAAAEIGKGLRPFPSDEEIRENWT
jgi:hypothetical protein